MSRLVKFSREDLDTFRLQIAGDAYQQYQRVFQAFRALPHQALTVFEDSELCEELLRELDALTLYDPPTRSELSFEYSTTDHIRACARGHIEATLRGAKDWNNRRVFTPPLDPDSAISCVPSWCSFMSTDVRRLTHQLWHETTDGRPLLSKIYTNMLAALETDGAILDETLRAFDHAIDFFLSCKDDPDWPEFARPGAFEELVFPLTESPHEVTRNLGGFLLGELCGLGTAQDLSAMNVPSHSALFEYVAKTDRIHGGIAAPFVHGARLEIEPVSTLGELPHDSGFSLRTWLLRVMDQDRLGDPVIGQPLWFPLHEHFSSDLDAVMTMIDRGQFFMAKMTAEEDWYSHMRPAVERLCAEADESIARAARYSLEHWWPKNVRQLN